jgi:hypothetical protein
MAKATRVYASVKPYSISAGSSSKRLLSRTCILFRAFEFCDSYVSVCTVFLLPIYPTQLISFRRAFLHDEFDVKTASNRRPARSFKCREP